MREDLPVRHQRLGCCKSVRLRALYLHAVKQFDGCTCSVSSFKMGIFSQSCWMFLTLQYCRGAGHLSYVAERLQRRHRLDDAAYSSRQERSQVLTGSEDQLSTTLRRCAVLKSRKTSSSGIQNVNQLISVLMRE